MSNADASEPGPTRSHADDARAPRGVLYRERLWPGPWVWIGTAGVAAALGIAYGAALGTTIGWVTAVLVAVIAGLLIWRSSVTVVVGADALVADRAVLPWWASGQVLALDAAGVRQARGAAGDPTAFAVMRPGVGPGAVVIEITDAADPHATWLIGSRDAEAMARAILEARGRLAP